MDSKYNNIIMKYNNIIMAEPGLRKLSQLNNFRIIEHWSTVKLGYIKLGFYEYMAYIEVLSRPERNPIDFNVK